MSLRSTAATPSKGRESEGPPPVNQGTSPSKLKAFSALFTNKDDSKNNLMKYAIVLVMALNLLLFQAAMVLRMTMARDRDRHLHPSMDAEALSTMPMLAGSSGWNPYNPLEIPRGAGKAMPSVRVEDKGLDSKRKIYGGVGDKAHLGGFTEFDIQGISPTLWTEMITDFGVRSVLDVGCGRGISSRFFLEHGVDVLCAEGSHDAVTKSFLPLDHIVEHDFSRGPWWPEKTYDAVWSVEFLEHVSRQYHFNYMTSFRKAALLFVTTSRVGGWHHVEVHQDDWWIRKYESYGFRFDQGLTDKVRKIAMDEGKNKTMVEAPDGRRYNAQLLWLTLKVFINPAVAALPQHAHLFPEDGCIARQGPKDSGVRFIFRRCGQGGETALPDSMLPLPVTPDMYERWEAAIKKSLKLSKD